MALAGSLSVTREVDGVRFAFTVTNTAGEPRELHFRSGQTADVVVLEGDREVWRWSDGRLFTQALRTETLAAGEAMTHEATWDAPAAGEYDAVATLEADDADVEARASFVV